MICLPSHQINSYLQNAILKIGICQRKGEQECIYTLGISHVTVIDGIIEYSVELPL
ncbi:hypothetical protein [Chitinophaga pinensis]|uniref:hypothetical protein n=1 Tax=Chitinophaga pinensis TaxID=79329 RepID=UPI0021BD6BC4|nr:hypothetical protein [Chitinophaga pinensis]